MNENKAVPNIRFNDFENKWEKEKLNQIVKKVTRKNSKLQTSLSLTISAECGIINQNLFFNRQIASRDMSNYFLIKQGEFAYNKSYSKSAPFGTIKRLNRYNQGALSSLYIVFCPTKANSDYLVSYFDSSYWYKQLSMISTEGVRNHGLLNVSLSDFFDMILLIPRDDKEQQKIGNLFTKLDKLLYLQQQKIDKLDLLKKALLQKLFPIHDAKTPELRFKEFEDDWKKTRIGKIVQYSNSTYSVKDLKQKKEKKFYSVYDATGRQYYSNSFDMDKKYIAIIKDGSNVGAVKLLPARTSVLSTMGYLGAHNSDIAFDYYLFKKLNFKKYKVGSGIPHIYFSDYKIQVELVPQLSEQQKIGNLLFKSDKLIELENKKLQNLQQFKKCLLQNMFVE